MKTDKEIESRAMNFAYDEACGCEWISKELERALHDCAEDAYITGYKEAQKDAQGDKGNE